MNQAETETNKRSEERLEKCLASHDSATAIDDENANTYTISSAFLHVWHLMKGSQKQAEGCSLRLASRPCKRKPVEPRNAWDEDALVSPTATSSLWLFWAGV